MGTAQLVKKCGIPSGGGGFVKDSQVSDEQAGYEKILTVLTAVL